CATTATNASNLRAHIRTHSPEEKKYFCEVESCNRRFLRSADLERHKKTHSPRTKMYVCEYCMKGFTRKDSLMRHQGKSCGTYRTNEKHQFYT
ncbi:hypothetical protein BCR41DRAFT_311358, partial [Lobosporangium transversale]